MRRRSILMLILLISVLIVTFPGISEALQVGMHDLTGYRTADPADPHYGIFATDGWGDVTGGGYFEISWIIEYGPSIFPLPYKYEYTFYIPEVGGGLSHFIIEVTKHPDVTADNFLPDPGEELKTHKEKEGNPNMPANIYGIKTNTNGETGELKYIIYSDRAPMWGDLYAKDGQFGGTGIEIYAYNLGIGTDPTWLTPSFNNWIAVPNRETIIPEPGTLILMILGVLGLAGVSLKRKLYK